MFYLNPAPTFEGEVAICVPGAAEPAELVFLFKHKTSVELLDWSRRVDMAVALAADVAERVSLSTEVVAGWPSGPCTAAGVPVPFSPEALAELLQSYPGSFVDIARAYSKNLMGGREKNSVRRRAPG